MQFEEMKDEIKVMLGSADEQIREKKQSCMTLTSACCQTVRAVQLNKLIKKCECQKASVFTPYHRDIMDLNTT